MNTASMRSAALHSSLQSGTSGPNDGAIDDSGRIFGDQRACLEAMPRPSLSYRQDAAARLVSKKPNRAQAGESRHTWTMTSQDTLRDEADIWSRP